jgi:2-polyprenyl-6-methoxyphenol hydroxylase-like FAD-dependent oxidoreductase
VDATADVVIVGAGPVGLMLAVELCLGGVVPVVLERLPEISDVPKGNGMIGQIVKVLDYRGLLEPFRADATYTGPVPGFDFGPLQLDFSRLPASPLHVLAIPQRRLELQLAARLEALGGALSRSRELTTLAQDDHRVSIGVLGPDGDYRLSCQYLVGCDGARSTVRKLAGIGFPGVTSTGLSRIGRVRIPGATVDPGTGQVSVPGFGLLRQGRSIRTQTGEYSLAPLAMVDKNAPPEVFIVATREEEPGADPDSPVTLDELRASVRRVLGADLAMTDPLWLTKTVGNSRQADRYRAGRVLLAGDAAHIFGSGGSLNVGLLDAVNLGWKLAAQVRGNAPAGLLDSYHRERHAAGERALMHTRAQRELSQDGEYAAASRRLVAELLEYPEVVRHLGELIEGSDVRYEMTAGPAPEHPLAGQLAPDIRLRTPDGSTRVAELVRTARPVLLDFTTGQLAAAAAAPWSGQLAVVTGEPLGLPTPADALLIRPDGYVAWAAGPGAQDPAAGLPDALRAWVPSGPAGG